MVLLLASMFTERSGREVNSAVEELTSILKKTQNFKSLMTILEALCSRAVQVFPLEKEVRGNKSIRANAKKMEDVVD